jgi:1-acyl-sn-glycerol-3-phosphate acyltransferase
MEQCIDHCRAPASHDNTFVTSSVWRAEADAPETLVNSHAFPLDVWPARGRLASLWLSQVARIIADFALRLFILFGLVDAVDAARGDRESAWHLLAALVMLPAVLLAPFNGALCNSLPRRWVLTGSAVFCCAVVAVLGLLQESWIACWALLSVGVAVYGPTRYALLPGAAVDTHLPLTRVNGWIEMGGTAAIVVGLALGLGLNGIPWDGWPATVVVVVGLNVLATLAALPVWFRADTSRPEGAAQALAGFFRDTGRIWRDGDARLTLLGLSSLRGIITGATGAFIAMLLAEERTTLVQQFQSGGPIFGILVWILVGAAAGSLLAGAQRHPRRALGLVPLGLSGLVLGLILAATGSAEPWLCVALGVTGGLVNVPLAAAYQIYLPADARGNGMAVRSLTDYVSMAIVSGTLFGLSRAEWVSATGQLWLVVAVASVAALVGWCCLYRETIEQLLEIVLWPFYRVRGHGPGLDTFPLCGPVLVVSNHAAWFDPVFLAKVLPRRLTPMMTSAFYDKPGLYWVMKYVAGAIRVQWSTYRRDVPEIRQAVEVLDQGGCVVLFPEGFMRRTEEKPLRRFGQGAWHILRERPQTPVVVCWIEGNWKSFFSYYLGPPTKNKRMDFWRHVDVVVSEAQPLPAEILAEHRATRARLEQTCLQLRGVLGLEVAKVEAEEREDEAVVGGE